MQLIVKSTGEKLDLAQMTDRQVDDTLFQFNEIEKEFKKTRDAIRDYMYEHGRRDLPNYTIGDYYRRAIDKKALPDEVTEKIKELKAQIKELEKPYEVQNHTVALRPKRIRG